MVKKKVFANTKYIITHLFISDELSYITKFEYAFVYLFVYYTFQSFH